MDGPASISFDGLADLYDETRCFDARCFEAALGYITDRFPVRAFPDVCEPGIGTGRIALPLAARGYRVTGVDISRDMLDILRRRIRSDTANPPIAFLQADVTGLVFPENAFDLAVVVHLFYFLRNWKKAAEEILRVVRRGGCALLMHTGTGMEIPALNDRYAALCAAAGSSLRNPGVNSTKEAADHYRLLGCAVDEVRDRWQWTAGIPLGKAIEYIRRRAYSFTVLVPEEIHRRAVQTLLEEAETDPRGLIGSVDVPNQIHLTVVQKP
jgi:SAM-dependent methyltransferase